MRRSGPKRTRFKVALVVHGGPRSEVAQRCVRIAVAVGLQAGHYTSMEFNFIGWAGRWSSGSLQKIKLIIIAIMTLYAMSFL
jgi:hypothetical protein